MLAAVVCSAAQTNTGDISGVVRDAQGGVLPGVLVVAEHIETFDTSAFSLPAPFTFGSAPRNSVAGPGYANMDLAVARTWTLPGGPQFEFRWEVFNVLNRANLDLPSRVFGTPNFGRIFSAKNPREMQLGAKLSF